MDGVPLDAITQDRYLLSGSYDAEKFSSGEYVLAIGPAVDSADAKSNAALPVPSVGSSVAIENHTYYGDGCCVSDCRLWMKALMRAGYWISTV